MELPPEPECSINFESYHDLIAMTLRHLSAQNIR